MMIQLDKNFVEERKKKEKDKYYRYQIESFKDYQEYIKKKDVSFILLSHLNLIKRGIKLKIEKIYP